MSRRKIKETYEVSIEDNNARVPVETKVINAGTPEDAIELATDNRPSNDTEVFVVKRADVNLDRSKGVVGSGIGTGVVGMADTSSRMSASPVAEKLSYPYTLSVPDYFIPYLTETELKYKKMGHTNVAVIENKNDMRNFLVKLTKSKDPMAKVMFRGIRESIK